MTLADAGARGSGAPGSGFGGSAGVSLRGATVADAPAIHRLIAENLEAGHLLPRSIADIEQHASRFVVAYEKRSACPSTRLKRMLAQGRPPTPRRRRKAGSEAPRALSNAGTVVGCAELAPLSPAVAEVRSLVVDQPFRGRRIGAQLVAHVAAAGAARGFATLCAFTHQPAHFVRLGFTIVPHVWMPEKIAHDCTGCALFRRCGQYAVTLPLRAGASVRPEPSAAVIQGRGVAARRTHIERLQLQPVAYGEDRQDASAEPVSA